MASCNTSVPSIHTHEGAKAKHVSPLAQLERSVMSCMLWESEFYEDGKTIADRIKGLAAQVHVLDLVRVTMQAKRDMRLRHAPLLLARELMRRKDGRSYAQEVFSELFTRPDDATEFLALYWKENKDEPLAKQVKKYLGEAFRKWDEYQLQKYNRDGKAFKLRDVLRLCRPKPADEAQSQLWKRLVKGELATPDTWEVELSKSTDKKASWERLLGENKLGGLALLRNLRNMVVAGLDLSIIRSAISSLHAGRLLPINFIAAAKTNPQFEPELEQKFLHCFFASDRKKLGGDTIVLIDVSGSMDDKLSAKSDQTRMDVACSLAMISRETFTQLRVFTFSDDLKEVPVRRGFGLRDAIVDSQPHGNTVLGQAIRNLPPCERLIVVTDEQSHDSVPDRRGYLINVASAKNGVGYGSWRHIDGWSDKVIDYVVRNETAKAVSGGGE